MTVLNIWDFERFLRPAVNSNCVQGDGENRSGIRRKNYSQVEQVVVVVLQPLRRLTTIFSSLSLSATALSSSLSCSSVTFCLSWPVCASVINRFSISVARLLLDQPDAAQPVGGLGVQDLVQDRLAGVGCVGVVLVGICS